MNRPEPTQREKRRRALIFLAVIIGVPTVLLGVYMLTLGRSPLAGTSHHDFGVIPIEGNFGRASHVFKLTNRTQSTITITDVRTTCGCTTGELASNVIEPGEMLEVTAALSVTRPGKRRENIHLQMDGRGTRTLSVVGVGRPTQPLRATVEAAPVLYGRSTQVTFTLDVWPDEWKDYNNVPDPLIHAPEGVTALLSTWALRRVSDSGRATPAQWRGQIILTLEEQDLPSDAELSVQVKLDQVHELRIPLHAGFRVTPQEDF